MGKYETDQLKPLIEESKKSEFSLKVKFSFLGKETNFFNLSEEKAKAIYKILEI